MEFKGTKGKWYQSHRVSPESKKGMYSTQVYDETGETIATLAWFPMPAVKENGRITIGTFREANAKLIAAAPEMFEILSKMHNELECGAFGYDIEQLLTQITK